MHIKLDDNDDFAKEQTFHSKLSDLENQKYTNNAST